MTNKRVRSFYSNILYEKLNEIFDCNNIERLDWKKLNKTVYSFEITLDSEPVDVWVDFIQMKRSELKLFPLLDSAEDIYNVTFAIGDEGITTQFKKTNSKIFVQILCTMSDIVNEFIKSNSPDVLLFFATGKQNKELNDNQKLNSYRAICDKHIPTTYETENTTQFGKDGFLIYNRQKFQGKNFKRK